MDRMKKISDLRNDVDKALTCLYLEVEKSIADDVKTKVNNLINAYEEELNNE